MNYCNMTGCGQAAIYSRPLPMSINKLVHFCPKHYAGLIVGQSFKNGGVEINAAVDAANNLLDLVEIQGRGLWNEELASDFHGLQPTMEAIRQAKTPKDITG